VFSNTSRGLISETQVESIGGLTEMAYFPHHYRDYEDWREQPEKTARLYMFDSKLEEKEEREDKAAEKLIGNILTDYKWWSERPEKAYSTLDEGFLDRASLMLKGRRGVKPRPKKREWFFDRFFDRGIYQVASLYADKADLNVDQKVDEKLYNLLESEDRDEEDLKEAFTMLDSFNYGRTVDEFHQLYRTDYLDENGPDLVIDQIATDILSDLDGSSKAFFQMYIAPRKERPKNSFSKDTVAETYPEKGFMPRKKDAYIEDGLQEFERRIEDRDLEQAKHIVSRFDLPSQKVADILHEKPVR